MERHYGSVGIPLMECINPLINKWRVRWDVQAEEEHGGVSFVEAEFLYRPALPEIKQVVLSWYNSRIDDRIRSGFAWREMPIWLSSENQFNYKAAYDLAIQTAGASLPVTFKFGTEESPVYKEFTALEGLSDFYMSAMAYVNGVLAEGWLEKDGLDWSVYE